MFLPFVVENGIQTEAKAPLGGPVSGSLLQFAPIRIPHWRCASDWVDGYCKAVLIGKWLRAQKKSAANPEDLEPPTRSEGKAIVPAKSGCNELGVRIEGSPGTLSGSRIFIRSFDVVRLGTKGEAPSLHRHPKVDSTESGSA